MYKEMLAARWENSQSDSGSERVINTLKTSEWS